MSTAYHPLVQRAKDNLPECDDHFEFRFLPPVDDEEPFARRGFFSVSSRDNSLGVEVFPQEGDVIHVYANWPDDSVMLNLDEANGADDETLVYKGPYQGVARAWPYGLYPLHRALVMIALGLEGKNLFN